MTDRPASSKQKTRKPREKAQNRRTANVPEKTIFFPENAPNQSASFPPDIVIAKPPRGKEPQSVVIAFPGRVSSNSRPTPPKAKSCSRQDLPSASSKKSAKRLEKSPPGIRSSSRKPKNTAVARSQGMASPAPRDRPLAQAISLQTNGVRSTPRATAVAIYRKNTLFDAVGYWLRSTTRDFSSWLSSPRIKTRKKSQAEMLAEENASLRAELA
ncbi:MAG: hypothetical protein WBO17_11315, partial [Sphingorhabdus sp.]